MSAKPHFFPKCFPLAFTPPTILLIYFSDCFIPIRVHSRPAKILLGSHDVRAALLDNGGNTPCHSPSDGRHVAERVLRQRAILHQIAVPRSPSRQSNPVGPSIHTLATEPQAPASSQKYWCLSLSPNQPCRDWLDMH